MAGEKKTQAEKFEEMARELGCEDDPAALDRVMRELNLRKLPDRAATDCKRESDDKDQS